MSSPFPASTVDAAVPWVGPSSGDADVAEALRLSDAAAQVSDPTGLVRRLRAGRQAVPLPARYCSACACRTASGVSVRVSILRVRAAQPPPRHARPTSLLPPTYNLTVSNRTAAAFVPMYNATKTLPPLLYGTHESRRERRFRRQGHSNTGVHIPVDLLHTRAHKSRIRHKLDADPGDHKYSETQDLPEYRAPRRCNPTEAAALPPTLPPSTRGPRHACLQAGTRTAHPPRRQQLHIFTAFRTVGATLPSSVS